MPEIEFKFDGVSSVTASYAVIYGDVPRFRWLPRWFMRWSWFRKTELIAYFEPEKGSLDGSVHVDLNELRISSCE